jgi:hypothetical protein
MATIVLVGRPREVFKQATENRGTLLAIHSMAAVAWRQIRPVIVKLIKAWGGAHVCLGDLRGRAY